MKGQSQNWVVLLLSLYTSRLLQKLGLKSPAAITFVPAAAATHVVNKAQPITKEQGLMSTASMREENNCT
jgi:hypothetical protein